MAELLDRGWTLAVGLILTLWFLASVINQFSPAWWRRIARRDKLGVIPRWTFFAPNPAREDLHIVYRDQNADGWTTWRSLTPAPARARLRWLWNPGRFERKAAIDFANGFRRTRGRVAEQPELLLISTPYVGTLSWASRQPRAAGATHRQFAILTSSGFPPTQSLSFEFLSEAHRL